MLICGFLLPLIIFVRTWVFKTLWLWFLVPLGVMEISLAHAFGLIMLFSFLWGRRKDMETPKEDIETLAKKFNFEETLEQLLTSLFISLFALGMGWVVTLFM